MVISLRACQRVRQTGRDGVAFGAPEAVGCRAIIPLTPPQELCGHGGLVLRGAGLYRDSHASELRNHGGHPAEPARGIARSWRMKERHGSVQTVDLGSPHGISYFDGSHSGGSWNASHVSRAARSTSGDDVTTDAKSMTIAWSLRTRTFSP